MDKEVANQSPRMFIVPEAENEFLEEDSAIYEADPMQRKETLELVKAYYKIPNRKAAKHLFDLIVAMSKTSVISEEDEK